MLSSKQVLCLFWVTGSAHCRVIENCSSRVDSREVESWKRLYSQPQAPIGNCSQLQKTSTTQSVCFLDLRFKSNRQNINVVAIAPPFSQIAEFFKIHRQTIPCFIHIQIHLTKRRLIFLAAFEKLVWLVKLTEGCGSSGSVVEGCFSNMKRFPKRAESRNLELQE